LSPQGPTTIQDAAIVTSRVRDGGDARSIILLVIITLASCLPLLLKVSM